MLNSSIRTVWEKSYAADLKQVDSLNDELLSEAEDHATMNDHAQLESSLVHMHSLTGRINELKAKYEKELAKDSAESNALLADVRNRLSPTALKPDPTANKHVAPDEFRVGVTELRADDDTAAVPSAPRAQTALSS